MERRLYRSRRDRVIAGVCGGIAEQMQVDPTLVRVAAVALALITHGGLVIAYVVMAFVVPEEPLSIDTDGAAVAPQLANTFEEEKTMAEDAAPGSHRATHRHGGVGFGVVLIVVGLALLAHQFIPDFDIWLYWPVVVIFLGIVSVMRGLRG